MTDTTDIGELPKARVYSADAKYFYSIELEDPVGPFRSAIAARRACRDAIADRAGALFDVQRPFVPVASTPEMRNRLRELATPPRDDFDRAVLIILDDFDRLSKARAEGRTP